MKITRRRFFVGTGAMAGIAAALGGYAVFPGGVERHALDVVARVYGPDIATTPAARDFARAYESFVREKGFSGLAVNAVYRFGAQNIPGVRRRLTVLDESIVTKFATSTNVVLSSETGAPLVFTGIFHPYLNSCANQLSALARG